MRQMLGVWLVVLAAWVPARAAQLVKYNFETGLATWSGVGDCKPLTVQNKVVHEGSALECHYTLSQKGMVGGAGVLMAPRLAEAKSIHFWVRTDQFAVLSVALKESGGAQYQTLISSYPNTWYEVNLSLDRLRLAPGAKDDNNGLDLDQVNWAGVMDITKYMPGLKCDDGERTLWLDDFSIDSDVPPTAYSPDGKLPYVLDNFSENYLGWVAFDGTLARDAQEGALVWQYPGDKPEGTTNYIIGPVGMLPAKGATHLLVTLSAQRATQLFVVLKEEARDGRDESRYSTVISVPASPDFRTYTIALKDLRLDTSDGGADENGHLDLDQVSSIVVGDLEVLSGLQPGANKVFLDEIQLVAAH